MLKICRCRCLDTQEFESGVDDGTEFCFGATESKELEVLEINLVDTAEPGG